VPPREQQPEPFHIRTLGVLWATCSFVVLSDLVLGYPPPFLVTVGLGWLLTLGVELQARLARP
jgi:hypothetical protein